MSQPLSGVRIADFSHVMAGPFASHLLRLMGAEVIKIEPTAGDGFRNYGPDRRFDGMSPAFLGANAGKKSIALDLKREDDLAIARQIVSRCDVMLENFRPGVIGRLGLGYEAVRELRKDIIFCSVSGYGQQGPRRDWPAIDNIVQATSGLMMLSGEEGEPPIRIGFPIVDTLTGQTAALAILAALNQRERTGQGAFIDVAMFDATLAFMTSMLTPYLVTGKVMSRMGNVGYSGLPTASLFLARDGRHVSLGVVQQNQFESLARYVGAPHWLDDPLYATADARRKNSESLNAEIAAIILTRDAEDWEAGMSGAGIPCGMVRRVDEAAALAGRGALLDLSALEAGDVTRIPNAGFQMEPGAPGQAERAPRLDEHRDEILDWLRSDAAQVRR
jgi:CoA:oxalate CoA-transferase